MQFTDGHGSPRGPTDGHGDPMAPILWPEMVQRWSIADHEKFSKKEVRSSSDLTCSCGVDKKQSHSNVVFFAGSRKCARKMLKNVYGGVFFSDSRC